MEGILKAAKLVTAKIKETGQKPKLLHLLPEGDKFRLKPNGITYLKGNLGLFNQYEFDSKDIFGLKEGVAADYTDFRLFVFLYKDTAFSMDFSSEKRRKSVDAGNPYTMQSSGNFVSIFIKFSPGMQHSHYDFKG